MELKPRKYVEGDYKKYIQVLTKNNMQELFLNNFGGWSDSVSAKKFLGVVEKGFVWLFFLGEEFVGYVSYETEKNDEKSYLIHDIHIVKEYQQKGYGTKILDFVVEKAIKDWKKQLKVFVFENNPSLKFYNKYGFEKTQFLEKSKTNILVRQLK